jgi:hypothetical protein
VTSAYQEITGLNISGRKLKKILKLIRVKPQCKAASIIAHPTL